MKLMKKFLKSLFISASIVASAQAADVAPLEFSGVSSPETMQKYWDKLMSFKMWGTNGIQMGHASTPDISGAIGTADGNMVLINGDHNLGGPIYVGGSIEFGDGPDRFLSGPVRVTQNFAVGQNSNKFYGKYCIEGSISKKNKTTDDLNNDFKENGEWIGHYYSGNNAKTDACAYDSVPEVPTYLSIPDVPALPENAVVIPNNDNNGNVLINGTRYFLVPPVIDGKKMYDFYINGNLQFGNNGRLVVVMQSASSLARYFINGVINVTSSSQIQIAYVNKDAYYEDGEWKNLKPSEYTYVENKDYAGNVLFHSKKAMTWPSMNGDAFFQGSFISLQTMELKSNLVLAGQLLAKNLIIGHEFDGKSFRYVPFDPPILKLEPEVGTKLEFPENDDFVVVPIKLEFPAKVNVYFDYCFEVHSNCNTTGKACIDDIGVADEDEVNHPRPICGQGEPGKVAILQDHDAPDITNPNVSVWIKALVDDLQEGDEIVNLVVSNLSGAVMPGDKREGVFPLTIVDADREPKTKSDSIVAVEDELYTFAKEKFAYSSVFNKEEKGIMIVSLPEKGTLLYKGAPIEVADKFIPVDSLAEGDLQYLGDKDGFSGTTKFHTFFKFKVVDEDSRLSKTVDSIKVYVIPVNDAPVVNDTIFDVVENSTEMDAVLEVPDVDDSKFDFAFDESDPNYEEVSSLFTIDGYGRVQIKDGAVLNFEVKNEYTIKVKVTDEASTTNGAGKETVSAQVTIKILDDNEKPVIRDTTLFVAENVAPETEVGKVTATDEDTWTKFTYSLADTSASGKDPVATLFTIDGNGLIQVAEGADLNYEERNEYTILAIVHDNGIEKGFDKDLYDTATITIKINDVNEDPKFDNVKDEYNVVENTPVPSIFATVLVFDPDAKDVGNLNVSLTDNKKVENVVSAEDLFTVTVVPSANADSAKYGYVKIAVKSDVDYEALYANHFDAEAQKVLFDVTLHLVDESGVEVTAVTRIRVDDSNEAPTIEDAEFAVDENSTVNTEVGALKVTDPDAYNEAFRDLVYNIVDEGVPFVMDSNRVLVNGELNHEVTTTYTFKVAVKDRNLETLTDTADVIVTIVNVNENPDITCKADDDNCNGPFYVDENSATGTEIHSFAISDVDADDAGKLTATLSDNGTTGADTLFDVVVNDANTEVSIVVKNIATLDYEKINPTHEVVITVIDAAGLTDTLIRTIHVNDVNEKPILADKNFTPDENIVDGDVVGEMVADEPDTKNEEFRHLEYTIITENMPFAMDTNKIVVSDASSLNFETSPVFEFEVEVKNCEKNATTGLYTEKCLADTANVKVSLQDVNEKPDIACKTGDANCNGPFYIDENSETGTEIHTFAISDVDADDTGKLTVSLSDNGTTGADTLFTVKVNEANTEVSIVVLDISKLDFEKINPKHEVVLTVTDAAGLTDTLIRTIYVNDVNEAPVIADNAFEPDENLNNGDVVGEMVVDEPDTKNEEFRHLDYAVITPDMPFAMDGNKVIVTDATKLDFETSPVFTFQVEVKNCEKNATTGKYTEKCLADTADVTVTLQDVNENPDIKCFAGDTNCDGPYNVNENSKTGYAIHPFSISDVDAADAGKLTATLSDNSKTAPTGADSLFTVKLSATNDSLYIVVKDGSKLDYEKVKSTHEVLITLSDAAGLTDTLIRTIHVIDVNEKPTVKDAEFAVNENSKKGDSVGVVNASDPDVLNPDFGTLYYSLLDSTVGAAELFDIDNSGKITVAENANLNYETDSVYYVKVRVTDKELSDTATVKITLKDVSEKPKIIIDDDDDGEDDSDSICVAHCDTTGRGSDPSDPESKKTLTVAVNENSPTNTEVFSYVVDDEDLGEVGMLSVSLKDERNSGTDSLFKIEMKKVDEKWKVVVSVKDGGKLDYEKIDPRHEVTVIVTDPNGLQDSIRRVIEVRDVNEAPTFVTWPFEFTEHNEPNVVVGHVEHGEDVDTMAISGVKTPDFYIHDQFKLTGGANGADTLFTLLPNGDLVANKRFDFETDPHEYAIYITLSDTLMPDLTETDTVWITLLDKNETPWIETETVDVDENVKKGTVVDTVKADDYDLYDTVLTFTLVEDHSGCFDVAKSGVITVKVDKCNALDYEKNTELPIKVKVTDTKGASETKTIRVVINDVNEAPHITDQTISVPENHKINTVVDTVKAEDPDKDPKYTDLTYTVIGGDTTVFKVNPKTGELILKDSLDYETKKEYSLTVRVDDGEFADTAKVTIKVTNIPEKSEVVIVSLENIDTTYAYPDTVYTNKPDATITWTQDKEVMSMDTTFTPGKNVIIITYKDPAKDTPGSDTLIVFYSSAAPEVIVTANADEVTARNIYTIVEKTNDADTSIYVNDTKNDIRVTIRDSVSKKDSTFVVKLDLDTLHVSSNVYKKVEKVAEGSIALNETPSRGVVKTPINGNEVQVAYKELVGGDTVEVTYKTDLKGDVVKTAVINEKGKVDSIEVITVSYNTVIDGKMVKVSYQADAVTGAVLVQDASGNLMTESAASKSASKDKKNDKSSDVARYQVTYEYEDASHNTVVVTYAVDEKGSMVTNAEGDKGYTVSYTYVNKYGNAATQSVYIVLDQVGPSVKILSPEDGSVIRSNFVNVVWTVNGEEQDTLTVQGLEKGANVIVRFYRDKAGNEASDTVFVVMKDGKNVDISVEQPVTEMTPEKVEEYYAENPPVEGQTFAVSIRNPSTDTEVETLIGGSFKTKKGSGETPYPGVTGAKHLGPTLALDVKLPSVSDVGGLATMDDLLSSDGLVPLDGVDADNSEKITVEEFVDTYCEDGFKITSDMENMNLYRSKMDVHIWIYTSLGSFVDYFSFTQDLNDPTYPNEAGMLQMFFEMKPGKDGNMRTEDGRLYATGAYLYKVQAKIRSELRCTLPPVKDATGKKRGDVIKSDDDLLKPFGYKRPREK